MKKENAPNQVVGIDKKIPFIEKLMFSSCGGIGTFYFMMIQMWLLFFYTDIMKINAGYVGIMFVIVRVFDAIFTPFFGAYIDKQNTRWGRYKPWTIIIWTGILVSGFFAFLPVNFGSMGNTIYATISYVIFSVFMSVNQAPGMGMTASMSKLQDDRMTISILGFVWVLILSVVAQVGSQPIMNILGKGDQATGFKYFMLAAMVVFGIWFAIVFKVIKERFTFDSGEDSAFTLKNIINGLTNNKYAVITIVYVFALNLSTAIRSSAGIYYYKYYFNDANLLAVIGGITILPTLIGSFFTPLVTKKLGIKYNLVAAVAITIVTSVAMFALPPTENGKNIFIALSALAGFFVGMAQPAQGTMLPLAVDYGEWKNKTNSGGFLGAVSGFAQTLSTAISGGLTALVLALVNYVPNAQQTGAALTGIKFMMTVLPGIAIVFGFIIFMWDITDEKHKEIIKELNERRKAQENLDVNQNAI